MSIEPSLVPLAGGHSGETFRAESAGERTVVRIYGPRSAWRGPLAPEVDAAVLELVRGLVPVADVLEVRRGDPDADVPGLLVTSLLPGRLLEQVLPELDADGLRRAGRSLGTLIARLGHMVQPRAGLFADRSLSVEPFPPEARTLDAWVGSHAEGLRAAGWDEPELDALRAVADTAQDLLDAEPRCVLVHSDLNPKNVLVDPQTQAVTGVLDWEFAHAGSPYADLGNLLRFDRHPEYVGGVLAAYEELMPSVPADLLDRARAADLFALVELASRRDTNPVVERARDLLRSRTGHSD